jgi:hypothetical protein
MRMMLAEEGGYGVESLGRTEAPSKIEQGTCELSVWAEGYIDALAATETYGGDKNKVVLDMLWVACATERLAAARRIAWC